MRLDWLHKIMTLLLIILSVVGGFIMTYDIGPHDSIDDEILYSLCSLILSLMPIAFIMLLSTTDLFPKSLLSFTDSTKKIYHNYGVFYINYSDKVISVYQLSLFTIKKIDRFILIEKTIKEDIDKSINEYFKKSKSAKIKKNILDTWDGTIGASAKRNKRLNDILK